MTLYAWPARAALGRAIPKTRIYTSAGASRALQARFVDQIARMEWTHVLRPDILNLPPSSDVEEIAVIAITMHSAELDPAVLVAIEKAIPRPLIFELNYAGRTRIAAAWKRPSLAEAGKWVTAPHAFGPWQPAGTSRQPLPSAVSMSALYAGLLDPLLPAKRAAGETLAERAARAEQAAQIAREISRLEAGLRREKQFNRKVELNAELRAARARHAALMG